MPASGEAEPEQSGPRLCSAFTLENEPDDRRSQHSTLSSSSLSASASSRRDGRHAHSIRQPFFHYGASLLLAPTQLAGAEVAALEADMLFHTPAVHENGSASVSEDSPEGHLSHNEDAAASGLTQTEPELGDCSASTEMNETVLADASHEHVPNGSCPPCSGTRSPLHFPVTFLAHSPTCPSLHPPLPSPTYLDLPRPISGFYSPEHGGGDFSTEFGPLLPPRQGRGTPRYGSVAGRRSVSLSPSLPMRSSENNWSAPEICCGAAVRAAQARRRHLMLVYSATFCVCFFTSLEANTAYLYFNWGLSEFGALASYSMVSIAQQMVYAVAKPPIALISDIFGRAEALAIALALYTGGYSLVASSSTFRSFLAGVVIQSAGTTGIQVLQSIIVADTTSPQYRGLVLGIVNLPYLINFGLAGPLAEVVVRYSSWRFGIGVYALLVPLSALPLLLTLSAGESKARSVGLSPDDYASNPAASSAPLSPTAHVTPPALSSAQHLSPTPSDFGTSASYLPLSPATTYSEKFRRLADMDFIGLLLFAVGWLLVLLPLTLRDQFSAQESAKYGTAGVLMLGLCLYWQTRTPSPIVPLHVLKNKQVIYVCLLGLVDFASFTLTWTYLSAFVQILRGWDQSRTAYFATTQNITSTLIGLQVGYIMSATRRFRTLMILGVVVRIIGVALMVRFRNSYDPTPLLVLCQLLQGVGGGAVAITMQVAAQVCASPSEVATVTAFQLLVTEVGAALGSALAGLIVSAKLPRYLAALLPHLDSQELRAIYGSLHTALSYPLGSIERTGIIEAWVKVMHITCIGATAVLFPALLLAWAMPDATLRTHSQRRRHLPRDRAIRRPARPNAHAAAIRPRTLSHTH